MVGGKLRPRSSAAKNGISLEKKFVGKKNYIGGELDVGRNNKPSGQKVWSFKATGRRRIVEERTRKKEGEQKSGWV